MVREQFPSVQILTVNSHTGQLVLGASSPTALSAQLTEVLYCGGNAQPNSISPVQLRRALAGNDGGIRGIRGMVGDTEPMQRVYELTNMVARRDTTVLVTGESGTGKDLIAQAIHLISPRQKQPLVVINCAAIPEPLLEAELFGYVKGSFTGAVQSRIGRIHAAHGGTLFLDEIGDMPLSLQSKILRFLEQGEVQRLGGNDNLKVDVRVVAATNADLRAWSSSICFARICIIAWQFFPSSCHPCASVLGDIEKLAETFLAKFCPGVTLSVGARSRLCAATTGQAMSANCETWSSGPASLWVGNARSCPSTSFLLTWQSPDDFSPGYLLPSGAYWFLRNFVFQHPIHDRGNSSSDLPTFHINRSGPPRAIG